MKHNETIIRVRYKDTDQMGVAYYANYFIWFEVGRCEFFRGLGMSYKNLEQNEIFLPVIEAYCKYKYPARYDDELKINTRLNVLQEVKLAFQYEILSVEKNKLLVVGETTHAFVNKRGKPVVLRKHNPFLWKSLQEKTIEKE
ncbi:MAG: thioesterase family protein [Bacillota bacterium]|nr:thioesterase family protein [Bacillota bacterium]